MGTNYFHESQDACDKCGAPTPGSNLVRRHIGKSSAGWCFALHVYPAEGIYDLVHWVKRWKHGKIVDEYGGLLTTPQMLTVILVRLSLDSEPLTPQWLVQNDAYMGPFGLARAAIRPPRVLGPGCGTYDRITGGDMGEGW